MNDATTKTEKPEPKVASYATKALERVYPILSDGSARKLSSEEIDDVDSLLNILACALHPETRLAGESMNFVALFHRVHGKTTDESTALDRAYYHIALAQSALIGMKNERKDEEKLDAEREKLDAMREAVRLSKGDGP